MDEEQRQAKCIHCGVWRIEGLTPRRCLSNTFPDGTPGAHVWSRP